MKLFTIILLCLFLSYSLITYIVFLLISRRSEKLLLPMNKIVAKSLEPYKDIIDKFDGIEVYHPDHSENFKKELLNIAKERNLIITGGSDYHGNIIENKFEEAYIEDDDLQNFLKSVNF